MEYTLKEKIKNYLDSKNWGHKEPTKKAMLIVIEILLTSSGPITHAETLSRLRLFFPGYRPSQGTWALRTKKLMTVGEDNIVDLSALKADYDLYIAQTQPPVKAQEIVATFLPNAGELILKDIAAMGLSNSRQVNPVRAQALVCTYLPKYTVNNKEVSAELVALLRSELGYTLVVNADN